jgi:hypothetical protein
MNFFIGQRVRVVGTEWNGIGPKPTGKEGRITGRGFTSLTSGRRYDWELHVPGYAWFCADTGELEPILPSGAHPSEFTTLHDLLNSLEGVAA